MKNLIAYYSRTGNNNIGGSNAQCRLDLNTHNSALFTLSFNGKGDSSVMRSNYALDFLSSLLSPRF